MKRKFMTLTHQAILAFFLFSSLLISPFLSAQRQCASALDFRKMQLAEPERYRRFMELEAFTERYLQTLKPGGTEGERLIDPNTSIIIIPVVVHVLWNTAAQNISDAQIQSQIAVLNEDFRRLNADRVNTPGAFTGVASDFQIEFRLACVDPTGAATTGITRTQTTQTVFNLVQNGDGSVNETSTRVKFTSQGGRDAWPTNRYLNMWVANLGGGLLGYAQFPADYASKPNTDGVVCRTTAFGRTGNVVAPFNLGRTATHEVGHWLNLFHIWGDANCGNDQVGDTPTQQTSNLACPAFPRITCSNGPNGDMFMNYMDYTDDACMNIFTAGQRTRARAVFNAGGPRASFINNYFAINTPAACNPTSFSVSNPACLTTVNWTVTSPLSITGGQGTNQITVSNAGGNPYATVTATVGGYTDSRNVTLSAPTATPTLQLFRIGSSCYYNVRATLTANDYANGTAEFSNNGGASWYEGTKFGSNTVEAFEEWLGPASVTIRCRLKNSCGVGPVTVRTFSVPSRPPGCLLRSAPRVEEELVMDEFKLYPNPGGERLTIALPSSGTRFDLRIVDLSGRVVKIAVLANAITQLDISALKSGVYFIQISGADGKQFKSRFTKL